MAQRKQGPQGLAKVLTQAAERMQERASEIPQDEDVPPVEDLNILPMPETQEIVRGKWIQWLWRVGPRS